jgi:hypothetical protein
MLGGPGNSDRNGLPDDHRKRDQDNDEDDQAETLDMRLAKVVVLMPL